MKFFRFNPFRCMRGAQQSTATNYATVELFNDSNLGEWIAVLRAGAIESDASPVYMSVQKGPLGSTGSFGVTNTLISQEAKLAGQLHFFDTATQYQPDGHAFYYQGSPQNEGSEIGAIAIIKPGYSYVMQAAFIGLSIYTSFLWQVLHRADFSGKCLICDTLLDG